MDLSTPPPSFATLPTYLKIHSLHSFLLTIRTICTPICRIFARHTQCVPFLFTHPKPYKFHSRVLPVHFLSLSYNNTHYLLHTYYVLYFFTHPTSYKFHLRILTVYFLSPLMADSLAAIDSMHKLHPIHFHLWTYRAHKRRSFGHIRSDPSIAQASRASVADFLAVSSNNH